MFVADVALASSPTEDRTAAGTDPVRKCRPEYVNDIRFIFPALAHKFPVLSEKFPVLLRREFRRKPLICSRPPPQIPCGTLNFAKFPVNFPVSRELNGGTGFKPDSTPTTQSGYPALCGDLRPWPAIGGLHSRRFTRESDGSEDRDLGA